MKFSMPKNQRNLQTIAHDAGYQLIGTTPEGELNCVRRLGGDYPRFHLYVRESGEQFIFSLHLDQKKPSYGDETAHSGEYDGDMIKDEVYRIAQYAT